MFFYIQTNYSVQQNKQYTLCFISDTASDCLFIQEAINSTGLWQSNIQVGITKGINIVTFTINNSDTDIITITNIHTVEQPTGKYNVVLRKVDNLENELSGAKIKVDGKE